MTGILLVGRSRETLVLARRCGLHPSAVVDPKVEGGDWLDLPAFASDEQALATGDFCKAILAIDAPRNRAGAFQFYSRAGIELLSLCASPPGEGTTVGKSLLVQRLAHLSVDCHIGHAVRINVGANVMHDVTLADFVTVAPNAVLLARVRVGERSYIGAGAVLLPDVTVGCDCLVGAGAVVTRDVADGQVVKGVPAY